MLLILLSLLAATAHGANVQLGNTTIIGKDIPEFGQEFFGGIPFAEPPLGKLRFRPPVLKTSLSVPEFNATSYGSGCIQVPFTFITTPGAEDCLTLNIVRPSGLSANGTKLPVMAWIYGGGFIGGSGTEYNGSTIVAHSVSRGTPIIYVNFNYRLGPLGFPQGNEAAARGSLNLGLKDQLAALHWIQKNIAAFGGDPEKVTLAGESAGSVSIGIHFFNKDFPGLTRGAIMESGGASTSSPFPPGRRQEFWASFVGLVPECASVASSENTFDCLTSVPSSSIATAFAKSMAIANEQIPWGPVIDGKGGVLPDLPSNLYKQGKFARIPFITGTCLDEATRFTSEAVNSSETIRQWIITNLTMSPSDIPALEKIADRMLELYPDDPALGSPYNTGNETFGLNKEYKRLSSINGDVMFQSVKRLWMQTATKHNIKTFGYMFTELPPPQVHLIPPEFGVGHVLDVPHLYPYVIPGVDINTFYSPPALKLSGMMLDFWISFVVNLDPNDEKGDERPHWPQYTLTDQELFQLNGANLSLIKDDYRKAQIDFINAHSVLFRH